MFGCSEPCCWPVPVAFGTFELHVFGTSELCAWCYWTHSEPPSLRPVQLKTFPKCLMVKILKNSLNPMCTYLSIPYLSDSQVSMSEDSNATRADSEVRVSDPGNTPPSSHQQESSSVNDHEGAPIDHFPMVNKRKRTEREVDEDFNHEAEKDSEDVSSKKQRATVREEGSSI